jgi:hypothetical protein
MGCTDKVQDVCCAGLQHGIKQQGRLAQFWMSARQRLVRKSQLVCSSQIIEGSTKNGTRCAGHACKARYIFLRQDTPLHPTLG